MAKNRVQFQKGLSFLEFLGKLGIPPKLDSRSTANWTPVPGQTGQSERSDARG